MAQVPAGYSPYGHECRSLFIVPEGKVLIGADAAALELRDLAGYMARYDAGAYVTTVLNGIKAEGTDIHSVNARALGLDPLKEYFDGETGRDIAKTWFYAFIYGAGDEKLGQITTRQKGNKARMAGKSSRSKFMKGLPALAALAEKVRQTVKEKGFLRGLDGRLLTVRSQHAALNTLLQSAGAIQMKRALVILDRTLQAMGFVPGIHYEFVANVHDEWQIEADQELGETIGKAAVAAIRQAGESFGFRCPLDGEFRIGRNWSETH
jgi:DNA polymerase I-like protein with 3'-5' exonuclease and polymerase domains